MKPVVSTYLPGGISVCAFTDDFSDNGEFRGVGLSLTHERTNTTRYLTADEARELGEALIAAAATRESARRGAA